ncbi:unnamed protein product [Brassicogethes aeneus]|uniref:Uncharacterized protein n=1 Tax=Brassicogethes aeneus TaxID=1431903 RepID=A0A9P0AXN0_BRAAE|nr:unnamed protein product [Brassicogethes aeneus]
MVLLLKSILEHSVHLKSIRLRFLVSGHSFLPNDSDFGDVECAIKRQNKVFCPEDYINIMKTCKKKRPIDVHEIKKDDFVSTRALEKVIMTTRKPFGELSKSQKNRRLKRDKNGSLLQQIPSPLLTRHDVNIFSDDKQDTADCTSFNNFTLPENFIEHQDDIISDDNGVDFIQMGISDRVLTVKDVDVGYSVHCTVCKLKLLILIQQLI